MAIMSKVRAASSCCFVVSYLFLFPPLQRNTTSWAFPLWDRAMSVGMEAFTLAL